MDFLISFLMNLLFRLELLVLAVLALLLHVWFDLPIAFFYAFLGLWVILALLITLGLGVLTKGTPTSPKQKNVNPYSRATKDFMQKPKNTNAQTDE